LLYVLDHNLYGQFCGAFGLLGVLLLGLWLGSVMAGLQSPYIHNASFMISVALHHVVSGEGPHGMYALHDIRSM